MNSKKSSLWSEIQGFFNTLRTSIEWLYDNVIWAVCGLLFLNTVVFAAGDGAIVILAILNGFILILLVTRLWKSRKARGY